jgi:hypothetical protein
MTFFPRPPLTINLNRGPLKVAMRRPPEIFRPSHRTARDATAEADTARQSSRNRERTSGDARAIHGRC